MPQTALRLTRRAVVLQATLAFAILISPAHAQQAGLRPFNIDDALNIRSSRIDAVSRDGHWAAVAVRVRRDGLGVDAGRYDDATYVAPSPAMFQLIDATTGKAQQIFPGKVDVRAATFSKDGSQLAFLLRKGDDWSLNVYDIAASRLRAVVAKTTKAIASNSPLVWAPGGNAVLVALRPEGWTAAARAAFLHQSEGDIVVEDSRLPFLAWDSVKNINNRQIPAIVTVADGAVREILPETDMRGPLFSADGSYLAYSTALPLRTSYDRTHGTDYGVFRVKLAAGSAPDTLVKPAERRLTPQWNESASAFAYADRGNVFVRFVDGDKADSAHNLTRKYRTPVSSSDTAKLSYAVLGWRPDGGALLVGAQDGYHVLDVHSDSMSLVYPLSADTNARPKLALEGWSRDGRYLYLARSAHDHWARGIERYDLSTKQATELASDVNLYSSWHVSDDGSRFVFERSDGDRPNEVYTAGRDFSDAHALTNLNPQLAGVALAHSELVKYRDVDGNELYGVLYYPYGYQPGKKYPLVAEVYEGFFDNGFNEAMDLLAARGWFAFHPSVDLHIGYPGEAWMKGVTGGINSLEDKGLVDGTKLGVEGTSYGGYAVNLLITQTNRFAAAVNISGKVDIVSFLGDSPKMGTRNYNAAEEAQDRIGATLWQAPQKYIQHSAIFAADRITTPLLMLTGKQDWNVPYTNEREMYYALRRLGKEAVWVQYEHAGHGAGRNGTEADFRDHWQRMFEWFDGHFVKTMQAGRVSTRP
ncbi:MAG TPA: prolyl oligopeptidase family serine peptidase [Gemmatimonadaceae bacterium]|jgi:dipeptidyl aminopeptidase/acylaminoacyl peptidase|nr:prolyl oligopeptidase family serine peptidase [Gemmatimonadaceae bacterium]